MKKQFMIIGVVFLFGTIFLIAMSTISDNAKADSASGTWVGTCTDHTYVANFYYDAVLRLTGESSVSGTLELTCTDIDASSGWADTSMIGTVQTAEVYGTMSGSTLTLDVYTSGGTFTFYMTVSGSRMTGGSQYAGATTEINTWTFDLTGGGGGGFGDFFSLSDLSVFAVPSSAIALTGGVLGVAVSFLPAPRGLMDFMGRSRGRQKSFNHPFVRQIPYQAQQPPTAIPPPPPPVGVPAAGPAPLSNPVQTLGMPLEQGPTNGDHLVPWDAPRQCEHDQDPRDYPYQKGTSAVMRCSYCGCNTLSPFTTGWFCTNPLCPARREWLQKRCTHHEFNNMTWRQP